MIETLYAKCNLIGYVNKILLMLLFLIGKYMYLSLQYIRRNLFFDIRFQLYLIYPVGCFLLQKLPQYAPNVTDKSWLVEEMDPFESNRLCFLKEKTNRVGK